MFGGGIAVIKRDGAIGLIENERGFGRSSVREEGVCTRPWYATAWRRPQSAEAVPASERPNQPQAETFAAAHKHCLGSPDRPLHAFAFI